MDRMMVTPEKEGCGNVVRFAGGVNTKCQTTSLLGDPAGASPSDWMPGNSSVEPIVRPLLAGELAHLSHALPLCAVHGGEQPHIDQREQRGGTATPTMTMFLNRLDREIGGAGIVLL